MAFLFRKDSKEQEKSEEAKRRASQEHAFLSAMTGVRGDGTQGSTDYTSESDRPFDLHKVPDHPPEMPDPVVKPPPVEHESLMSEGGQHRGEHAPPSGELDDKHLRFLHTFSGVADGARVSRYEGEGSVPDNVDFDKMPSKVASSEVNVAPEQLVHHRPPPKLSEEESHPVTGHHAEHHHPEPPAHTPTEAFAKTFSGVPADEASGHAT